MCVTTEQRSATEIVRRVREQAENYDPLEKLLQIQRDLFQLEQKYGLHSDEFYRLYQAGQMGDDVEMVGWAGRYRLFLGLRSMIADGLDQVITFPVAATL